MFHFHLVSHFSDHLDQMREQLATDHLTDSDTFLNRTKEALMKSDCFEGRDVEKMIEVMMEHGAGCNLDETSIKSESDEVCLSICLFIFTRWAL